MATLGQGQCAVCQRDSLLVFAGCKKLLNLRVQRV
jgi:hypothetical protein